MSLLLDAGQAAAAEQQTVDGQDRQTGCRVSVPARWQSLSLFWSGDCPQGRAAGLGVVRAYDGSRLQAAFYGDLVQGRWSFGVLEEEGGYAAGHFKNAEAIDTDERNVLLDAFRVASKAAGALGDDFAAKGNAASATHYRRKAKALAEQLD